jgi:N-acetylneuraminic acid mutarotase
MTTVNAPSARGGHSAVWTGSEMIVWGGGWVNTGGRYNPSTDGWIATSTTNAPTGRSGHSAVWTGTQMIVWGGGDSTGDLNTGGRYNPGTNSWTATSTTNAPSPRDWHTAVWTGSQMIVWGGYVYNNINQFLNTGGMYNPTTNSWTATTTVNAPSARQNHTAVWTGSQMIVWGGINFSDPCNCGPYNTGGRYDPGTNSWTATSTTNAPAGSYYHTAVWTGSEMIIWGGETSAGFVNTGSRYNPSTNSWTATTTTNAPPTRWRHSAVWTGSEMIVWGGEGNLSVSGTLNTGGRYNPSVDTWAPNQPPVGRIYHTVVWTGSEMIIWGGLNGYFGVNDGGIYNPATDSWTVTSVAAVPSARYYHAAVWTGSEMIVWGGFDGNCSVNSGGKYNPGTDSWTSTSTTNAPPGRSFPTAIWTGAEMIAWGGYDCSANVFNTGGKYDPSADTWVATSTINAPSPRSHHTAVWTGKEMVIWGGSPDAPFQTALNTGGRYIPGSDSWTSTSTTNAPSARLFHTATWTGSEMIVWGGEIDANYHQAYDNSYLLNTGGRYSPATDTWTMTSMTNAPSVRADQTVVWTGTEMIVWGGFDNGAAFSLNTGGKYDAAMNSWTPTSTTNNAPIGRSGHVAAWTGREMIVWGGINGGFGYLNNGGRYCGGSGPPQLASATPVVSRMTHGSITAPFDINLPFTGKRGVECRSSASLGSGNYMLVFTFTNNLSSVGSATVTSHNPMSGTGSVSSSAIGPNQNQYRVNLTNVSTGQYIAVTLNSVVDVIGNSGNVVGPQMGVLIGDTNADGFVDSADISQTKSQSGNSVKTSNFREDINTDTFIDSADIAFVKSRSGTALPSSP